jgi:hypothetical protein
MGVGHAGLWCSYNSTESAIEVEDAVIGICVLDEEVGSLSYLLGTAETAQRDLLKELFAIDIFF